MLSNEIFVNSLIESRKSSQENNPIPIASSTSSGIRSLTISPLEVSIEFEYKASLTYIYLLTISNLNNPPFPDLYILIKLSLSSSSAINSLWKLWTRLVDSSIAETILNIFCILLSFSRSNTANFKLKDGKIIEGISLSLISCQENINVSIISSFL